MCVCACVEGWCVQVCVSIVPAFMRVLGLDVHCRLIVIHTIDMEKCQQVFHIPLYTSLIFNFNTLKGTRPYIMCMVVF